jgi:hypothetical protein
MTFVEKSLVACFSHVWINLKAADAEILVYQTATKALRERHPEVAEALDAYLADARRSPAPQESIDQKYAPVLDTLVRTIPETDSGLEARTELGLLENLD